MAEKMVPFGFVRIHRSILINRRSVQEVRPFLTGEYGLRLKNGKDLTVTRTYKKNLNCRVLGWRSLIVDQLARVSFNAGLSGARY